MMRNISLLCECCSHIFLCWARSEPPVMFGHSVLAFLFWITSIIDFCRCCLFSFTIWDFPHQHHFGAVSHSWFLLIAAAVAGIDYGYTGVLVEVRTGTGGCASHPRWAIIQSLSYRQSLIRRKRESFAPSQLQRRRKFRQEMLFPHISPTYVRSRRFLYGNLERSAPPGNNSAESSATAFSPELLKMHRLNATCMRSLDKYIYIYGSDQ